MVSSISRKQSELGQNANRLRLTRSVRLGRVQFVQFNPHLFPPRNAVVSQCHSEEWSDEESAFWPCSLGTPTPIRHEYGRKADPSLALRMTRARFFGLRHGLIAGRTKGGGLNGLNVLQQHCRLAQSRFRPVLLAVHSLHERPGQKKGSRLSIQPERFCFCTFRSTRVRPDRR